MHIAIIGAGWLGLPLAQHLSQQGHCVFASRQTHAAAEAITDTTIKGFVCSLNETTQSQHLAQQLANFKAEVVIGCFPPGFRQGKGQHYLSHWQTLLAAASLAGVSKIIMVSATSVYPSIEQLMREEDASLADAKPNPLFSEKSLQLLATEQAVIDSPIEHVIIRASGLVGPNRHPARFAAKLKSVSSKAPANMLHLDDAIGITSFAIDKLCNCVVNATTPNSVTKADFYAAAIKDAQLASSLPPINHTPDKCISADKLLSCGYQFKYSNVLDFFSKR